MTARSLRPAAGRLFLIGGSEDKKDTRLILGALAEMIGAGRLVISTLASNKGESVWSLYQRLFTTLGIKQIRHLGIGFRDDSAKDSQLDILDGATAIFFTGGDQLKITTSLGGTALSERIEEIFREGGIVAGTSAGASALSEMMLVGNPGGGFHKIGDAFQMVPGLGLVRDVIIDQHFSERGRIRRLLGAVAQNPRFLGIGIDEDTAVVVDQNEGFKVIGSGAVYVVDGRELSYTNIAEDSLGRAMSIFGVKLHVLSQGDRFDLQTHHPVQSAFETEREQKRGRTSTQKAQRVKKVI